MPASHNLTIAGEDLVLRADRSLWWPRQKVLFIADLHAGKSEHMQRAGLRIPGGPLQADLGRLQKAIDTLKPGRVIVLGDLFHSDLNNEWDTLAAWCRTQTCTVELVRGNHDRFISDAMFTSGGLVVHEENYYLSPFVLRHHPIASRQDQFVLCGHVHPVYKLFGAGRDSLRLPCFAIDDKQLILPAYGSSTGGYQVTLSDYSQIVCTAPDFSEVVALGK